MSGEANVWNPRSLLSLSADTKRVEEKISVTTGQNVFSIKTFVYVLNTGSLAVYKNGELLTKGEDWTESSESLFSTLLPAIDGDVIVAVGYVAITSVTDVRDTDIFEASYQALRDYVGTEDTIYVQGSVTKGDGGESFFQLFTGAAAGFYVDNGQNILVPTGGDGSSGWLKSSEDIGVVDLARFVTNPVNASAAINAAATEARATGKALIASDASVTYVITAGIPINLEGISYIDIKAKLDTTNLDAVTTTGCILLGGLGQVSGGSWNFADIISTNPASIFDATVNPQVRVAGAKGIVMNWGNIRYLQFYMDYRDFPAGIGAPAYKYAGIAYNQIFLHTRVNLFEVDSTTLITDPLWFNENTIHEGRLAKVIFRDKGYIHNHNEFIRPLFEGANTEVRLETGHSNRFTGIRFENVTASSGVFFGVNATLNIIQRSWISGIDPRETVMNPSIGVPFVDNGLGNSFRYQWSEDFQKHTVLKFSSAMTLIGSGIAITDLATSNVKGVLDNDYEDTSFNKAAAIPGLDGTVFPNAFSSIAESALIPVSLGAIFSFEAELSIGAVRYEVTIFDSDGIRLDNATAVSSTSLSYIGSGLYQTTSNLSTTKVGNSSNSPLGMSILSANVAYVRFRAMTGDIANTVVNFITISYHESPEGNNNTYSSLDVQEKKPWLDTVPTTGHVPVGTIVGTPTGDFECVFELSTKITSEVANAATSVTVDDITNSRPAGDVTDGMVVGIALDDGTTHWDIVASLAVNTFAITALTSPIGTVGAKALVGASVVFVSWEQWAKHDLANDTVGFGRRVLETTTPAPVSCVAIGHAAGRSLEGTQNTVVGRTTGKDISGDSNTAIGANAMSAALSTGDNNVALGVNALANVTSAFNNVALGVSAGTDITGARDCVLAGFNVQAGAAFATNRIVIGSGIIGTANDQFSFGSASNVVSNDFGTDAVWSRISDLRYKDVVGQNELGLDFILGLDTVRFTMKTDETKTVVYGLIAQQVLEVLTKLGITDFSGHQIMENEEQTQKLKPELFMFPLIKAVQQLAAKVDKLTNES